MFEIFFFMSLLMSLSGDQILAQFSLATMTMEECQEVREEFLEEIGPTAEASEDVVAITSDCFTIRATPNVEEPEEEVDGYEI